MARNTASADSPPPPISPNPTMPLSVSTSTMVRTNRPQWHPLACRSGASSGTVTVVARTSQIFMVGLIVRHGAESWIGRVPRGRLPEEIEDRELPSQIYREASYYTVFHYLSG